MHNACTVTSRYTEKSDAQLIQAVRCGDFQRQLTADAVRTHQLIKFLAPPCAISVSSQEWAVTF